MNKVSFDSKIKIHRYYKENPVAVWCETRTWIILALLTILLFLVFKKYITYEVDNESS